MNISQVSNSSLHDNRSQTVTFLQFFIPEHFSFLQLAAPSNSAVHSRRPIFRGIMAGCSGLRSCWMMILRCYPKCWCYPFIFFLLNGTNISPLQRKLYTNLYMELYLSQDIALMVNEVKLSQLFCGHVIHSTHVQ